MTELTEEQKQNIAEEIAYVLGQVHFSAPLIRSLVTGADLPCVVASIGYLAGIIEAQIPELQGAVNEITTLTRVAIFPTLDESDTTPAGPGEIKMFLPESPSAARAVLKNDSRLIN